MSAGIAYRPEIDGLRAIAVSLVLAYHFRLGPFPGGFIGVDVFFVISGYLITAIVLGEVEAGRFTFSSFYSRRLRRILPALLVTIAITFAIAALVLSPLHLQLVARETAAAAAGVSNIHYWLQSGYFDVSAILKPLLHTWSLAVELQFYLVWPAFLVLLHRLGGRRLVLKSIIGVGVVITALATWYVGIDPSGAFFLTPFRINEFAAGAIVACLPGIAGGRRWLADAGFVAGFAAIVVPAIAFTEQMAFPGAWVLVPVAGTALVIVTASTSSFGALLRFRPIVWLGLISYSLYLVHWPVLALAYRMLNRFIVIEERIALVALAIVLAAISYRFVEAPFRHGKAARFGKGPVFALACGSLALLTVGASLHSAATGGWIWRFPRDLQEVNKVDIEAEKQFVWASFGRLDDTSTFSRGDSRILVLGDSQAADFVNLMVASGYDRRFEIATRAMHDQCDLPTFTAFEKQAGSGTPAAAFDVADQVLAGICTESYRSILASDLIAHADIIILTKYWWPANVDDAPDFVADLRTRTKARVYVVGPKGFTMSSIDMANALGTASGVNEAGPSHIAEVSRLAGPRLNEAFPVEYVDLLAWLCPGNQSCYLVTDAGKPVFWDSTHISAAGVAYLTSRGAEQFLGFLIRTQP